MDLHTFLFDRDSSKMLSPIPTKRFVSEKQFFRDITSNTYVYPIVFSEFCAMLFSYTQALTSLSFVFWKKDSLEMDVMNVDSEWVGN